MASECQKETEQAVSEKRQKQSQFALVLVVGRSQFRTNQGGIGQAKQTQFPAGGYETQASDEMSRLGRVPPNAGRVVIDRKACYMSLLAQAAVWLYELRVSQHFSTFYGSSVQYMDTQLGTRPRRRTLTIHRGRGQRTIALRPTVASS